MTDQQFDRSAQDLGNIVNLGHVNVCISDQHLATHYYITGLGLTRDPFLNTGAGNMWVNVGISQFHLPTGRPDVLRGVTGLVAPDRAALLERLTQMRKSLEGTKFDFRENNDCVETVCPWGNRINVHAPDETRFGRIVLGMPARPACKWARSNTGTSGRPTSPRSLMTATTRRSTSRISRVPIGG